MALVLKFDSTLDFFLPRGKQGSPLTFGLNRKASIKDIIESFGVPHTEVGTLVFEKKQIDFSFVPIKSGCVEVGGVRSPFDVTQPSVLRPRAISDYRFIADVNVMRLGKLMILLGFDVSCSSSYADEEIADIADDQERIVLTRDTDLLKRKKIVFARRLRENRPYDQLKEVISFFGLRTQISFFSRCTECNILLKPVDKQEVLPLLEPKTKKYFDTFYQCSGCGGVFWKGSHYENIKKRMSKIGILLDS